MELLLGGLSVVGLAATIYFALRWKGAAVALAGREREIQEQTNRIESLLRESEQKTSIANERDRLAQKWESELSSEKNRAEELRAERDDARQSGKAANDTLAQLRAEYAQLRETLDQERKQAGEKLALLDEAKMTMKLEFKALAGEIMKDHSKTFSEQNQEQIKVVLTPLREHINLFQQALHTAHTESNKERITLAEQIKNLTTTSSVMMTETSNLTRALKGEAQTQGAWGEMILESILERSGLRAGEEYFTQESHTAADGGRVRTDVIVKLPNGQRVIVDSKVSLTAFEAYVKADSPADGAFHLKAHLNSLRTHIKGLSSKEYHAAAGSDLDYVIMFVPIEGALAAALQEDSALTAYAVENNVPIATPTTLMIALRTIANLWQVERRNRNADEIAKRAGLLYDKFHGFIGDMQSLGTQLETAQRRYGSAMEKLSEGRGNIVRQVEQLKEMGAKTTKALPAALIGETDGESDDIPDLPTGLDAPNKDAAE